MNNWINAVDRVAWNVEPKWRMWDEVIRKPSKSKKKNRKTQRLARRKQRQRK